MVKQGRPKKWIGTKRERAELVICFRLARGESLTSICRISYMPPLPRVYEWLEDSENFRERYARARQFQQDTLMDLAQDIADDGRQDFTKDSDGRLRIDHEHVSRSRLRIDTIKFRVVKLAPAKYGDKQVLEHQGGSPAVMLWRPGPDDTPKR